LKEDAMQRIPRALAFVLLLLLLSLPVLGAGHSTGTISPGAAVAQPSAQQASDTAAEQQVLEKDAPALPPGGVGGGVLTAWLLVSLLGASGAVLLLLGVLLSHRLHSFSSVCAEPGSKWFG